MNALISHGGQVLMIAIRYPPQTGVGIFRTLKFRKFLPEQGWVSHILCGSDPAKFERPPAIAVETNNERGTVTRLRYWSCAESLSKLETLTERGPLKKIWKVIRKGFILAASPILIPDEHISFLAAVMRRTSHLSGLTGCDLLYSSAGPWTDHLVGAYLKKRFGMPLIVDFRDPWIEPEGIRTRGGRHWIETRLERLVVQEADHILVTAEGLRNDLLSRYPELDGYNITLITNGYDEDDFKNHVIEPRRKFVVAHVGQFYGTREPYSFFEGIRLALQKYPIDRDKITIECVGPIKKNYQQYAADMGLQDVVVFLDEVCHRDAIKHMLTADLLVAVDFDKERAKYRIPAKLFEYLRAGRRILFLSSGYESEQLLLKSNRAFIAPLTDVQRIAEVFYESYASPSLPHLPVADIYTEQFERRHLTAELARVFEQVKLSNTYC